MQEAENTKVVQDAYAAFGRGDVEGILDRLDDDVVWRGVYGAGAHVPTAGERRGKAQVGEFFKQVAQNVSFSRFEPISTCAPSRAATGLSLARSSQRPVAATGTARQTICSATAWVQPIYRP